MTKKVFDDLTGGVSTRDSQIIKDNQFVSLLNFGYNADLRLQTRLGYARYFPVVPDDVATLDALNATTGWSTGGDAATIVVGTAIRGSASLSFGIDVSTDPGNSATIEKSTLSADLTSIKGYIGFWINVPAGFNADLTALKFRLGTDSSNYYEWTLPAITEATNTFVKLDFADAATTGTLDDSSITYARLEVTYAAGYLDQLAILIDDIKAYSASYTTPVTSYFFNRDEAAGTNITIIVAGANMFLYNDAAGAWECVKTGLTTHETAEGRTTQRTRWEFYAYNGSGTMEVGGCDGVNNYQVWNGTVVTEYAAQPKCRYFLVFEDTIYSAGEDIHPLTTYYTAASPANAQTLDTSSVDAGNEQDGRVNGLFPLAQSVMIGKTERVYYFDAVNEVCLPIDSQNGQFSHRATKEVGNGILVQTKGGIDSLGQKAAVTGGAAVEGKGYSDDIQPYFDGITYNQLNASCGQFLKENHNYYISFDTGNDNVPDTTLVYSSLVGKAWTEYLYPSIYTYGYYIDTDNVPHYLMCSSAAGIIYEMETGFDDDGVPITYSFVTKEYNFKTPYSWKDFEYVTISGLKNEGSTFDFTLLVDGEEVYAATLDDTFLSSTTAVATIASDPIGSVPIGGGEPSTTTGIDVYPYQIRLGGELFAAGQTLQVTGSGSDSPLVMTLDRIEVKYTDTTDELFPSANFA